MCFKRNGVAYISSRSYLYQSGNRFFFINSSKVDRTLILELVNSKGDFNLKLVNLSSNEEIVKEHMDSNTYEFKIDKGVKYKLVLTTKGVCGHYKITTKDAPVV